MDLTVSNLLKYPFLKRPLLMQRNIIAGGRALMLKNLHMLHDADDNLGHFHDSALYEQVHWLVRCDIRKKFVCYICLLFEPLVCVLRPRMNSDLTTVQAAAKQHESSLEHMESSLRMQTFIMANFRTSVKVVDKVQHNLFVERNREILRRLIDAICCTVSEKHSHGDGKYAPNLIKVEDCTKFLQLLREQDKFNIDLVDGATDMLKFPRVINDLVDAITRVVKSAIKNETQQSTYVSLILSEHGAPQCTKSQFSGVLRYIKRGKVCERFIGFDNLCSKITEPVIYKLVLSIMEQYGITERFLALSLDGKVLPKEALVSLIVSVKIDYQYSYFVPWHAHGFGNVLLQTLFEYDECGLFLKKMQAMENFFENSKRRESLEVTLQSKQPELRDHKWYAKSPFIVFVASYRSTFIEFFDSVLKNCKYWESDDTTNAIAFRAFLQETHTVFLLQMFNKIFLNDFDETFNFIPESGKEMYVFDNARISNFQKNLGNLKFESVWDDVTEEVKKEGPTSKLASETTGINVPKYVSMFQKIVRHLYKEVDIRCNYLSKLKFCDLLNCNGSGKFPFDPQLLIVLMQEHGPFFKEKDLISEVAALNSNELFQRKTVHDLLECFSDLNLRNVFPQLYKLAEFILTLPYLPASRDGVTSKLRHINNCSYIPETSGIPSGEASFLCVESELLRVLRNSPHFYEDVFAKFCELNQYLNLMQV